MSLLCKVKHFKIVSIFLQGRPQYGPKGNSLSSPVVHEFSVPQGSGMGPKWFTAYTNPVHNMILKYCTIMSMQTTHSCIFPSNQPKKMLIKLLNVYSHVLVKSIWRMYDNCLNDQKTQFVLISYQQHSSVLTLSSCHFAIKGDIRCKKEKKNQISS